MKKIKSDVSFDNKDFKIKVSTVDKKSPTTIYLNIGTYVTPIDNESDFKSDVELMKKEITKDIQQFVLSSQILQKHHIFVTDIATDRLLFGKKSYLDMNLYIKPELSFIKCCDNNFHKLASSFYEKNINDIIKNIEKNIKKFGFTCTKSKN